MALPTRYILPVLLLLLSAFTAGAQSANFTVDSASGCAPLVVHFTNTTGTCSGCTYTWDFGNGDPTSPSPGPVSSSYTSPGTYTATLTVVDGGVTTTHSITITVYPPPTVSFTAADTSVCPGAPVSFSSTTLAGVPGPVTYTWAFGDGGVGSGGSPSHTYSAPGFYNVTLFATNSDGCQSSLEISRFVHIFTPPIASFTAPTFHFCAPPADATFTSFTTGTSPFSYTWEFGDGSPFSTSGSPVSHDYTSPGSYTVRLVVTDADGCMDSTTRTGYITIANLTAAFSGPDTACVNSSVTFANSSTPAGSISSDTWTFGDGSGTLSATTGHHTYTSPGTYTVTLVVSDGTCTSTITHTIVILPGPTSSMSVTPFHPCPPPTTVTFTGTVSSGVSITWYDGDGSGSGSTGTGTTFTHTYTRAGIYDYFMVATDLRTGCKDTLRGADTLYDLTFYITATPQAGCKPLTVNFNSVSLTYVPDSLHPTAYPYGFSSYTWNFGDGSAPGSGSAPVHTYTTEGVYTAVVTAITGNGCIVEDSIKIYVGKPPIVTVSGTPLHECYRNNFVTFTTTIVSGPADHYFWVFGDGSSETDSSGEVVHHFIVPGVFVVTVTPYYNGCPGPPVAMTDTVRIDSPKAIISKVAMCSPHTRVIFGDSSLGDDTHVWIFGDGTTSTLDNPIHDYPANAVYTVTLATYNAGSGCRDTAIETVDLSRPTPSFTAGVTSICKDGFVHFTSTVTGGTAMDYFWYRNGTMRDDTSSLYTDTFHVAGLYTIMLVIADQNGCLDSFTRANYITVAFPAPSFTVSPVTGCVPLTATFVDHSTDVTGTSLVSYAWSFGDGGTSTTTSGTAVHTYTASGAFTTKEIVTDNLGCMDSVSLPSVTASKPTASFFASNVTPCLLTSINFTSTSTDAAGVTITNYYWSFGDGSASTLSAPSHTYSVVGLYTVKLIVVDSHGCVDTATTPAYINVNKPVASFYMDDSVAICPPLEVHFINTSTGATGYSWDLGDGSTSATPSPGDLYITPGHYPIQLIATDAYGCSDTAYGNAIIYGYSGAFSYTPLSGCSPLTVNFTAAISNVPTIVWDYGDGNTSTVSAVDTNSHVYVIPGAYVPKLILSDNTGCQSSSIGADTIKVDAVIAGFTENPNPVCLGMTFSLVDTSKSYFSTIDSWNWLFNSATSTVSSPSFTIATAGSYPCTLQVTDGWGCTNTATQDVNVYTPPVIKASPDTIICVGDAATLTGYGGVSYTWADGSTLSCVSCNPTSASPTVITTYTVTGTDAHGCTNTDTTSVYLKTKTVSVAYLDTAICEGYAVQLRDSGATKFTWTPAGGLDNPHSGTPIAAPNQTTKYTIIAQLASCLPDTNTLVITVYPKPTVDAGNDQTVVSGTVVQLLARGTDIATYLWDNPNNILSCDNCPNPQATMSVTTHFTVNVASAYGCTAWDTVTVFIFCDQSQIFIPNTFTPNNDGSDDVFYPRGTGVSIIKSFRIYNRWGELLFQRNDININDKSNAWDGTYNGQTPRPDVYVYIIDAICETGAPINLKGDVTIIR